MDYETLSRRRQRLEKKRLRLVRFSGEVNPCCPTCKVSDVLCLHIDRTLNQMTCRNCRLKRMSLSDSARQGRAKFFADQGYPNPQCVACAEDDIHVLEEHHFFGEGNSKLSGPFCSNCHAIQSDLQKDFPGDLLRRDSARRALPYLAMFLFGIFILLASLGMRERAGDNQSLGTALLAISSAASAWAFWTVYADGFLALKYGPDYDKGMTLRRPS